MALIEFEPYHVVHRFPNHKRLDGESIRRLRHEFTLASEIRWGLDGITITHPKAKSVDPVTCRDFLRDILDDAMVRDDDVRDLHYMTCLQECMSALSQRVL